MFRKALLATALLGTTAFGMAAAAPLGPPATFGTDGGLVVHAKKSQIQQKYGDKYGPVPKWQPTIAPVRPLPPPPTQPPPPKGGKNYPRPGGGGVVIFGGGGSSCDVHAARCAGLYGTRTLSYRRCLRRAGC